MAVTPTALLVRPLPSLDHQVWSTTVSSTSLAGSSSSDILFQYHRKPLSFRLAISRITPVEEQKESQNFPPSGACGPKTQAFHAAPRQQGSREHCLPPTQGEVWEQGPFGKYPQEDGTSANAEAEKSAMSKIIEKLRRIQKGYHLADRQAAGNNLCGAIRSSPGTRTTFHSGKNAMEGYKSSQSEQEGTPTKISSMQLNSRYPADLKMPTMQTVTSVTYSDRDASSSKSQWDLNEKVDKEETLLQAKMRGPKVPMVAEVTVPREELIRLCLLGLQLEEGLQIGKLGVTKNVAISIQQQFKSSKLVKVRCEGPAAASIKKTALELEEKTGGMVVSRTGKIILLYRGSGYKIEDRMVGEGFQKEVEDLNSQESPVNVQAEPPLPNMVAQQGLGYRLSGSQDAGHIESEGGGVSTTPLSSMSNSKRESEAEAEVASFLEGLGPKFEDWTGLLPVPIDADLLPPVILNYRPPFRLLPYGIKPRLTDSEYTNLRRLARPLAPHFALGRDRGLQGLAAAMVKLWEKSEIAKVAVKIRVQNSNNLLMAEELRRLTGGVLLSRQKFLLTFYRGKDFVPEKMAAALAEREPPVRDLQELEEKAREERNFPVKWTPYAKPNISVIGEGAPDVKPSWVFTMDVKEQERLKKEAFKLQCTTLAHDLEMKLDRVLKKKRKAEEEIKKLNALFNPTDRPVAVETITEEERFMFQKLGLKMKSYLLLGRRGIFDGVVENMHLHWKHRELVKIVVKVADLMEVEDIARILEYESGGILVSISLSRKGYAIIMYRGKKYQRPLELRPRNLLTRRKALKKSLELQRHESLSRNIKSFHNQILSIQAELRKLGDGDHAADLSLNRSGTSDQNLSTSEVQNSGLPYTERKLEDGKEREHSEVISAKSTVSEPEMNRNTLKEKIKQLESLVRLGPLYRARPLSNLERIELRRESLLSGRAPQFFVGKHKGLEGLARGLRIYFLHHDLAQIVVNGRGPEMVIENVIHVLEELTGGVLVSRETNKIIMYRGWPKGFCFPFVDNLGSTITPELLNALEAEEDWEDDSRRDYMIDDEAEEDESELKDYNVPIHASTHTSDDGSEYEGDQMVLWEDIVEGSDE